jgi:hypothetical protein
MDSIDPLHQSDAENLRSTETQFESAIFLEARLTVDGGGIVEAGRIIEEGGIIVDSGRIVDKGGIVSKGLCPEAIGIVEGGRIVEAGATLEGIGIAEDAGITVLAGGTVANGVAPSSTATIEASGIVDSSSTLTGLCEAVNAFEAEKKIENVTGLVFRCPLEYVKLFVFEILWDIEYSSVELINRDHVNRSVRLNLCNDSEIDSEA